MLINVFEMTQREPEVSRNMSSSCEDEAATDEGEPAESMSSKRLDHSIHSATPSTAESSDTIDSTEEIHDFDEWELFSDTTSEDDGCGSNDSSVSGEQSRLTSCRSPSTIACHSHVEEQVESTRTTEDHDDRRDLRSLSFREDTKETIEPSQSPAGSPEPRTDVNALDQLSGSAEPVIRRKIRVVVRVRPANDAEGKVIVTAGEVEGSSLCVRVTNAQGSVSSVTECAFDRVFMGSATQRDVFAAVEPSVQACLEGYNATVFAYGQTGTGKTHTLFGGDLDVPSDQAAFGESSTSLQVANPSWGIVPRALSYLLDQIETSKDTITDVCLELSFLQIYNDRLFDLLTDRLRQKPLLIREQPALDGTTNVTIQGLSSRRVSSLADAMLIIHQGHINRCVRETEQNLVSSRSHAIVQLHVTTHHSAGNGSGQMVRKSRLNLVDLAGSEKWNTDVEMEEVHSQELKNINTSLSALGNCIGALTEAGRKHIPYRDSTLTRVLQDSFGGNTQSCLIATVNATQDSSDETIRTLQFADRARCVMQTIRVNEMTEGSTELLMAKIQIAKLRERLESEQRRRHDVRVKEHQALQRDFHEKLKGKEKQIKKLARDNAVFQRWRDEDVKRIRALESRIKDLEFQVVASNQPEELVSATAQLPRRRSSVPAQNMVIKNTNMEKAGSLKSITETDSGSVDRTYKQLLERLSHEPHNDKQDVEREGTQGAWIARETKHLPLDVTNQYELIAQAKVATLSTHAHKNSTWPAMSSDDSLNLVPEENTSVVRSPGNHGDNQVWTNTSFGPMNTIYGSLALSKSTPTLHKQGYQESAVKYNQPLPAGTANNSTRIDSFKSVGAAALNYGSLSHGSLAPAVIKGIGGVISPCQRHKLSGCMLCSVTMGTQQTPVVSAHQTPKEVTTSCLPLKTDDVSRKPLDGPCERHQLLRCFICMKGNAASGISSPIARAVSGMTTNSSNPRTLASAAPLNGRAPISLDSSSKCALHALDNCILCAGVKAMTRKVAPAVQTSPLTTTFSASANTLNVSEAARQRRYTLDGYQPAKTYF